MVRRRRVMDAQGNDVLSLLLQARDEAGTGLTDADLVAQTATLFVAGHEITARVLTWTLLLLALHPAVLASIQAELSICLHGAPPTAAQLSRAPGLERVLKESLRLLPPILWWGRVATRACALGEYRVPAGTHVVFSPFITHRLASVYSQPDRFLPDRWADTEPAPYTFIPFSGGPRMCLGAAYAMLEMKLILAVLVQRVRFEPMPEARVDRGGLLFSEPRGGLRVRVCSPDVPACAVSIRGNIRELVALVPE
jgi:cytochrome P450